jgi:hypothetical protein
MVNSYYSIETVFDDEGQPDLPVQISAEELTPSNHKFLFNFLRSDLSPLDNAINQILGNINIQTLEVASENKNAALEKVYAALKTIHPYYKFGGGAVVLRPHPSTCRYGEICH